MEPPVFFDYCHFRGCDVELEEQRLGLLDQPRYCRHRGYWAYLIRPGSRLCTRLAWHFGPGLLGASDDFLDNRSAEGTESEHAGFRGDNTELRPPAILALRSRIDSERQVAEKNRGKSGCADSTRVRAGGRRLAWVGRNCAAAAMGPVRPEWTGPPWSVRANSI
jgi:hypothetical protein